MKKGDLKKQEILAAAEDLFCHYGYEQTGIQDILDRLHSSKGSFYHHFPGKEALLEEICRNRAVRIFTSVLADAEKAETDIKKLDILLTGMIPLRDEKLRFLLMLLPVFRLQEGRTVRQYYCDALTSCFYQPVVSLTEQCNASGVLFCTDPGNASLFILSAINLLWVRITDLIIGAETRHTEPDLAECMDLTDSCRNMIEKFLSLPYGSVTLIDIPGLSLLCKSIHNHWEG